MGTLKSTVRKLTIRAVMFLLYLFIGAGIFLGIEKNAVSQKLKEQRWLNVSQQFRLTHNITEEDFKKLEVEMKQAVKDNVTLSWSYVNAFLFCYSVITTIGYGHITPKTTGGRLVMIIYALVGIPLTGYCLRCVGNEMTTFFGYLIRYFERRIFNREAEKIEIKCVYLSSGLAVVMIVMGGLLFTTTEKKRTLIDGIYFSFVTVTTIGFGDMVHESSHSVDDDLTKLTIEIFLLLYYVIGLSIMSSVIVSISAVIEDKTKKLDDPMEAIRNLRIENLNSKAMKKLGYKVDETYSINHGMMDEKRRGTIVPADDPPYNNGKVSRQSRVLSSNYLNLIRNAAGNNKNASQSAHAMNTPTKTIGSNNNNYHSNNNNNNISCDKKDNKNENKDGIGAVSAPCNKKNTSNVMNKMELRQNNSLNGKTFTSNDDSPTSSDLGIINPEYESSNPNSPRSDTKQFFPIPKLSKSEKNDNENNIIDDNDDDDVQSTEVSSVLTECDGIELDSTSNESKTTAFLDNSSTTNSSKSVYINMDAPLSEKSYINGGRCGSENECRLTGSSYSPNGRLGSSKQRTSCENVGLVDVSSNVELISIQKYSNNLNVNKCNNNDIKSPQKSDAIENGNFNKKNNDNQNNTSKINKNKNMDDNKTNGKFQKLTSGQHSPNHLTGNRTNSSFSEKRSNSRKALIRTSPNCISSYNLNYDQESVT